MFGLIIRVLQPANIYEVLIPTCISFHFDQSRSRNDPCRTGSPFHVLTLNPNIKKFFSNKDEINGEK